MNPARWSSCSWSDVLEAHVLVGEGGGGEGSEEVDSYQWRGVRLLPLLCWGGGRGGHSRAPVLLTRDIQLVARLHWAGDPGAETGPGGDGVDNPPRQQ